MGADLYFEQQRWHEPTPKAHWDGDNLVVERQRFYYYDWVVVWRGPANKDTRALLKAFGVKIPRKPRKKK